MPDTSQMSADELRIVLQSQQKAIRHLHARLGSLAVTEHNTVPDLNVEAVEQFLARQGDELDAPIGRGPTRLQLVLGCGTSQAVGRDGPCHGVSQGRPVGIPLVGSHPRLAASIHLAVRLTPRIRWMR